jgi:hypothetical protein
MTMARRKHDEAWVDRLGDGAWINWARAVRQQDPLKDCFDQKHVVDVRRIEHNRNVADALFSWLGQQRAPASF